MNKVTVYVLQAVCLRGIADVTRHSHYSMLGNISIWLISKEKTQSGVQDAMHFTTLDRMFETACREN
jgi:hypothetical protein